MKVVTPSEKAEILTRIAIKIDAGQTLTGEDLEYIHEALMAEAMRLIFRE